MCTLEKIARLLLQMTRPPNHNTGTRLESPPHERATDGASSSLAAGSEAWLMPLAVHYATQP